MDYKGTYAPTAKWISLRIFITLIACLHFHTKQLDVKTAFLYADICEDIYIKAPEGLRREEGNPFGLSADLQKKNAETYSLDYLKASTD